MRILHLLDHSLPETSGYAMRSHSIISCQRAMGWTTFQLTGTKQGSMCEHPESIDGIEYLRTAAANASARGNAAVDFARDVLKIRRRLRAVISDCRPDLVHAHSPCSNGLAAIGTGIPVVYEMRTLWEDGAILAGRMKDGGFAHRAARLVETQVLRRAAYVTTISAGLRSEVIRRGVREDRVAIIPNGVDCHSITPIADGEAAAVRRQYNAEGKFVIGYVGSIFAWEGLEILLQAFEKIRGKRPDARLLVVGTGPDEQLIRQSIATLGLEDVAILPGRLPHQAAIKAYGAIDVLVYPRLPMRLTDLVTPLKPLEAMALGKAIIASDVGGHLELIDDGRTGLLFRAGDSDALASAIKRIMTEPSLVTHLRENGLRYVRRERSWATIVAGYEPAYGVALRRVAE